MRIVYVLTSLGMGGAERQVLMLAERMAQRGHAVRLLVLRPALKEEWPTPLDITRLHMTKTPFAFAAALAKGRQFLKEFKPDLVHSHGFHGNLVARMLKALVKQPAVLSTIHNVYEGGWLRMLTYRLSDGLSFRTTAVSQAAAERFVQLKAVPAGKRVVLMNGIDLAEFSPDHDRRERMRAGMGVDGEFVWLTAGRIVPAKDYPNLLRAFAQVCSVRKDAQLWIAGTGEGWEAEALQNSPEGRDLGDAVRWLGLRRDMPALLDAADGFVLASAWEGLPVALAEAMAMQKSVVATDVGGVRELAGEAGLLVPAEAPNALAESMLNLMALSEEERQALGRKARERIAQNFNMETKVAEWEELYRSALT